MKIGTFFRTFLLQVVFMVLFVQVSFPGTITITGANIWNVTCYGQCNGAIELELFGGMGPCTSVWNNGQYIGTNSVVGLCAGVYSVMVYDNYGNSTVEPSVFIITEPTSLVAIISQGDSICDKKCNGLYSGKLSVTVMGGTPYADPPYYTYEWSTGSKTAETVAPVAGLYTVTVKDYYGCLKYQQYYLDCPISPALALQNLTIVAGKCFLYTASESITTGGDETSFDVESGGSATLQSGQYVTYLPGTHVHPGGYLKAFIAGSSPSAMINVGLPPDSSHVFHEIKPVFNPLPTETIAVNIYPNPTSGLLHVDLSGIDFHSPVEVLISDLYGKSLSRQTSRNSLNLQLSLEGYSPGMYTVKVVAGSSSVIKKIVKQ